MSDYNDTGYSANRNAKIASRFDKTGKFRTETKNRDEDSVRMNASTDLRNNSTNFFIDLPEGNVRLNGRQARSLYRVLARHYANVGKSLSFRLEQQRQEI